MLATLQHISVSSAGIIIKDIRVHPRGDMNDLDIETILIILVNSVLASINTYQIYVGIGGSLKYINIILNPLSAIMAALVLWDMTQ